VQDNISPILPLVFHLASTHLGRDTQRQIHWSVEGPRGSETLTAGDGAGMAPWAWAHASARRGGDGVRGDDGGRTDRSRPPVRLRGGSPSRSQFRVVGEVAKHGWG
jgi:hypothetical protein